MAERRTFLDHGFGRVVRTGGRVVSDLVGVHDAKRVYDAHQGGLRALETWVIHIPLPGIAKGLSYMQDPHQNFVKAVTGLIAGAALDFGAILTAPHTLGASLAAERLLISGGSGIINEVRFGGPNPAVRRGVPPTPAHH